MSPNASKVGNHWSNLHWRVLDKFNPRLNLLGHDLDIQRNATALFMWLSEKFGVGYLCICYYLYLKGGNHVADFLGSFHITINPVQEQSCTILQWPIPSGPERNWLSELVKSRYIGFNGEWIRHKSTRKCTCHRRSRSWKKTVLSLSLVTGIVDNYKLWVFVTRVPSSW